MASLPNDSGPYWRVIFRKTIEGKRRSKTFYFKKSDYKKSEVQLWKKRKELAFRDDQWSPWQETRTDGTVTLGKAVEKYMAVARKELAASTLETRKVYLDLLKDRLGTHRLINQVDSESLSVWVNRGRAYKTKMKRLEAVNALFGHAQAQGWAETPKVKVYAKRSEKKRAKRNTKTWVRPSEYSKVKEAASELASERMQNNRLKSSKFSYLHTFYDEFDNIFDFLINTALRRSDLLNLSTSWFIRDCTMMRIGDPQYQPKSQEAEEIIPLTKSAQQIARHWIETFGPDSRPFGKVKKRYFTDFFNDVFEKALPEKAHKLSAHKMRDSAIMYLLFEKGYSLQTVQQITRHQDLSTLNVYVHWAPHEGLKEIENKG